MTAAKKAVRASSAPTDAAGGIEDKNQLATLIASQLSVLWDVEPEARAEDSMRDALDQLRRRVVAIRVVHAVIRLAPKDEAQS